jgi:hypothetical protein
LVIGNLTYADQGLYICNLWNQKSIYYYLFVTSPAEKPQVEFANKMWVEGSDVVIKCYSQYSYPYPNIKWFRNGDEIKIDSQGRSLLDQSIAIDYQLLDKETNKIQSTLTITNVTGQFHLNNFTCKLVQIQDQQLSLNTSGAASSTLTNGFEVVYNSSKLADEFSSKQQFWQSSKPVSLNIGFKPLIHLAIHNIDSNERLTNSSQSRRLLSLYSDSNVVFSCLHTSNPSEPVKIVWFLNNVKQSTFQGNSFKWLKRSLLDDQLVNLTCEASNSLGKTVATYQISLLYAAKLKCDQQVYDVNEGNPLQVNCVVDAMPKVSQIEWRHYTDIVLQNNATSSEYQLVAKTSVLDFKQVTNREHAGFYECHATNLMRDSFGVTRTGSTRTRIELNVRFMPKISVIAKKLAANLSSTQPQEITCMTMSNPQPGFKWYKDGIELNTVRSRKYTSSGVLVRSRNVYESTLLIHDVTLSSDLNRVYKCEAYNLLGLSAVEIELVPLSRPDPPTSLRVLYLDYETVTLTWSAGFDGGFEQTFQLQINDTTNQFEIDSSNGTHLPSNIRHAKYGASLLNLTRLVYDTTYSIRLQAKNQLGSSDWSEPLLVKTLDLTLNDTYLLPQFDTLFLNVPKNRLEYTFRNVSQQQQQPEACLKIQVNQDNSWLRQCLPFNYLARKFSFDLDDKSFNVRLVKSIGVAACFQAKQNVCTPLTKAIIDTYNKLSLNDDQSSTGISHSSLMDNSSIPLALIIGICVCILSMLILLCVTIVYCIRRRNFKLCKALLTLSSPASGSSNDNSGQPSSALPSADCEKNEKNNSLTRLSCTNKSFNVDIASISAPIIMSSGASPCHQISHNYTANNNNNNTITTISRRAQFATTASNIIGKHTSNKVVSEILVTEDNDHHFCHQSTNSNSDSSGLNQIASSNTSSTGVSNSSVSNNNVIGPFMYNDFNPFVNNANTNNNHHHHIINAHTTSISSGSGSGSNTDPIAINNSLSSSNSSSSPTYGYNVASANNLQQLQDQDHDSTDSPLFVKTTNNNNNHAHTTFPPLMMTNQQFQQYQQHNYKSNFSDQQQQQQQQQQLQLPPQQQQYPESGYSTPSSRPKKVVYEVIV